jgi:hypothetical protein
LYGALGRVYAPRLVASRRRPTRWCSCCPRAALGRPRGKLLGALVAAGVRSRRSCPRRVGLLTSVAGVLSTDVLGPAAARCADFRLAALVAGFVPLVLALRISGLNVSTVVGLAFAVRRVELLSAAGARHLVAWADRAGAAGGHRRRRRRRAWRSVFWTVAGAPAPDWAETLVAAARGVDRAAGVHRDDRGVGADPAPRCRPGWGASCCACTPRIRCGCESAEVGRVQRERDTGGSVRHSVPAGTISARTHRSPARAR